STLTLASRPPRRRSTLFPYTTLFRSQPGRQRGIVEQALDGGRQGGRVVARHQQPALTVLDQLGRAADRGRDDGASGRHRLQGDRSEEHTSELQSQSNLVCRLLLEKKK